MRFLQIHLSMQRGGAHSAVKNLRRGLELIGHRCNVEISDARRAILGSDHDLVLFHSFSEDRRGDYLSALQLVQAQDIPHAVVLHDYWPVCHQTNLIATARGNLQCHSVPCNPRECGWKTNRKLPVEVAEHHCVCFTDRARALFAERGFSHLHVIPHGIDLSCFRPLRTTERSRFGVLFTNAWGKKDIKGYRHWEWLCRKMPVEIERMEMLGTVSLEDMPNIYSSADCTFFLSLWEETFGLTVIESLACGTPVISFPAGVAPDVIEDGQNGFLIPSSNPADVLPRLEQLRSLSTAERKRVAECCRSSVDDRFGLERMAERYVQLAQQLS